MISLLLKFFVCHGPYTVSSAFRDTIAEMSSCEMKLQREQHRKIDAQKNGDCVARTARVGVGNLNA